MMSACLATTARVGVAPRRGARPLRRVRSLTVRAAEEKKDDDKSIPTSLPPDVKTIPARDVDRNEYTGDWRTGKVWRPPRDANLPKFKVDLGKGTVTIVDEEEERKKYARMRAMNAAASGLATELEDPANPAQLAPFDPSFNPSLTAKPAGRKYPSAGLTSALEPSDLNRG